MTDFHGVFREQYVMCYYCRGLGISSEPKRGIYNFCTFKVHVDGNGNPDYRKISLNGKPGDINGYFGCNEFKSSGLCAHTLVWRFLMKNNKKAEEIPVSDSAPCGGNFLSEKKTYPHIDLRQERYRR